MSSDKDKVMKTLIEENLKLRNRIVQLERELEIMQSKHVDVLHGYWNTSFRFVRF